MYLASHHPEYSFEMEVLCSIPPVPAEIFLSHLLQDFELRYQRDLAPVIETLKKRFGVTVRNAPNKAGRVLSIPRNKWPVAKLVAETYWDTVYQKE